MESSEKAKRRKIPPAVTCGYQNTNASRDFYVSNLKKKHKEKPLQSQQMVHAKKVKKEKKNCSSRRLGQTPSALPITESNGALVSGSGVEGSRGSTF